MKPQERPEERRAYEELIVSSRMRAKGYSGICIMYTYGDSVESLPRRFEGRLRIFLADLVPHGHVCVLLSSLSDGQRLIASMPKTRNGIPMDCSRWIVSL